VSDGSNNQQFAITNQRFVMNHFINISDHSANWLGHVLSVGSELREQRLAGQPHEPFLAGKALAMYFEKPSLRTRVSFQLATSELGGEPVVLESSGVGLGERESEADFARVLHGMVHGIAARVFSHAALEQIAHHSQVPVINMLSDDAHPCQALADIMTMQDEFGDDLAGRTIVFVGDGNNVARSLAWLCAKLGLSFVMAAPEGFALPAADIEQIRAQCPDANIRQTHDPIAAVQDADAIYCDTFVSMGQEEDAAQREAIFAPYQVNDELLLEAPDHTIVLHCLPAHRGVEITDAVLDGPRSRVFGQAHNRLHAQKGLLAVLMGGK
jgi:ornithine carbamoyltransferase